MSEKPIKVQVRDPETDELLGEHIVEDDYLLLCAGSVVLSHAQKYRNGTHQLTIKGIK